MKIKKGLKKMIHYRFLLLLMAGFVMGQNALAQIDASGVVRDVKGEELIGVSVLVEGTTIGTITGLDGDFTLSNIPQGSTLRFSYMGYLTQTARAAANMRITLQDDAIVVDEFEVVGIGMGTARRGDLTGAISSLNASDMRQGVVTSSEQLLQGRIAGLSVIQGSGDPTKGSQLRLRGGSSLSGDNSPLVVVDGVAGVDMNTIPSADIISIDVLKDASAAAIYGSRAANGVILVTTKRRDKESRSANYSGYFGVANAAGKLDLLNANQWNENRSEQYHFGANTDWQDEIMQTALTQSHALTFSNITQKGGIKGSIAYLNTEGVVQTSKLERLGGTISGHTNLLNDYVTIELGISKSQDNFRAIDGPADQNGAQQRWLFLKTYQANPTWPVYNEDGTLFKDPNPSPRDLFNPLNFLKHHQDDRTTDRFMGYLKTDIWFLKSKQKGKENEGLKGTINLSMNSTDDLGRRYRSIYSQEDLADNLPGLRGTAARSSGGYKQQQIEMYLNYDKSSLDNVHRFSLMGGYNYVQEGSEGFGVGVYHFDFDDFMYNNLGAAKNLIITPGENGSQNFHLSGSQYSYSYKDESKLASFFGRVNYGLMGRYMFTATLRADGSSKFGPNHRWSWFPSASLAWRVNHESFMQGTKEWLDDLKLRAGYGVTGNQGRIGSYNSIFTYIPTNPMNDARELETTSTADGSVPMLRYFPTRNANEDLKWESTGQWNVGLDFAFWGNRLSGTAEFYHKKTTDLLYFYKVGEVMPMPYTLMNIGELKNVGVELSLNGTIMQTDNFFWAANMNLAHNKNEFLGFVDPRFEDGVDLDMGMIESPFGPYPGMSGQDRYSQKLRAGYAVGSFFGAKTNGLDENGNLIYLMKDGTWKSSADNDFAAGDVDRDNYLGSAQPKLTMGFGMNFNYKKFDLSVNTIGVFGQKVYNATAMVLSTSSEYYNVLSSSLGTNTFNSVSDHWLEDASFLRIQSITLGYTFDLREKTKNAVNSIRVYATVENPVVFTSYSGVDPEVSLDMNVTEMREERKRSPGIDNFDNYPKPRTFLAGLNIQF